MRPPRPPTPLVARTTNVDIEPIPSVYEPRIYPIELILIIISPVPTPARNVIWVDLEKIAAFEESAMQGFELDQFGMGNEKVDVLSGWTSLWK